MKQPALVEKNDVQVTPFEFVGESGLGATFLKISMNLQFKKA